MSEDAVSGPVIGTVAVLGLGEAGAAISHDLLASGVTVRGFDPLVGGPDGVIETGSDAEACQGADLVLSLTTAHEAEAAFRAAAPGLAPGTLFADLNTASADQLDVLPGVGPVLAQHIVAWRSEHGRFTSIDQLREVSGIGEAKFADLKPLVTV